MATKEQIAANRKNARKSTGPKSRPGKDKVKLNGLKHGLRAQQVVLPTEDPAEFQAFINAWMDDWKPQTMARAQLVEDAAVAAWRKKRCVRVESERLSQRVCGTLNRWRAQEQATIARALVDLTDEPRKSLGTLRTTRAGVARVIEMWSAIIEACTPDGWNDVHEHHFRILALCGRRPDDPEMASLREASWRLYLRNAPADMIDDDDLKPWSDATAESICEEIRGQAQGHAESYRRLYDQLPDPTPSWLRQAEAEAFAHPEDGLLQRYEAQLCREFHRSLADLMKLTESEVEVVEEAEEVEAPSEANSAEVMAMPEVGNGISDEDRADEPVLEAVEAAPGSAEPAPGEPRRVIGTVGGTISGPEPALRCA